MVIFLGTLRHFCGNFKNGIIKKRHFSGTNWSVEYESGIKFDEGYSIGPPGGPGAKPQLFESAYWAYKLKFLGGLRDIFVAT